MKIEMGESLFYSWLRHVKECQIVQTNWKASPQWSLRHEDELQKLMEDSDAYFFEKYAYRIYKQNRSLAQLLQQGECDVLGQSVSENGQTETFAVDVAFHEAGLNYGSHDETVMRVIKKCLRTAMCLYGYLDTSCASIVFASPKINPAEVNALLPCMKEVETLLRQHGLNYSVRLIANEDFDTLVLQPILVVSNEVSDTTELFLRSYQMYKMFEGKNSARKESTAEAQTSHSVNAQPCDNTSIYQELKVGKIAQTVLKKLLLSGRATEDEIRLMQTSAYSKQEFGLNYPLLVRADSSFEIVRYYRQPLTIGGEEYFMCSQWFEVPANNDRPYLLRWIATHGDAVRGED